MNHRISAKPGLLLVLIVAFFADEAAARKWTDSTGKFSIDAEFVELVDGQVALRKSDGQLIRLPLARLSPADQQHVRSLTASVAAPQAPAQAATPSAGDGATQTVIAEGVGASPDEALRDALRAAVNQVVGTVVDAETLVRNDQLVEDKILMYSNAFVKQYERISERAQGGLVRVRIRATVERRSLIAKLRAENVTVTAVDGQSMFAEAITKIEQEQGAEALLRKALEGFPANCMKAEVVGKPEIISQDTEKATIRLRVQFSADPAASKVFGAALQPVLEKTATDKGEFVLVGQRIQSGYIDDDGLTYFYVSGPLIAQKFQDPEYLRDGARTRRHAPDKEMLLMVNTGISKLFDQTQWRYYCLDAALRQVLLDVATRRVSCQISLLSKDGDNVSVDHFSVERQTTFSGALIATYYDGSKRILEPASLSGLRKGRHGVFDWDGLDFFIARIFIASGDGLQYAPTFTVNRDLQLSLDELKAVTSIQCALSMSEAASR